MDRIHLTAAQTGGSPGAEPAGLGVAYTMGLRSAVPVEMTKARQRIPYVGVSSVLSQPRRLMLR